MFRKRISAVLLLLVLIASASAQVNESMIRQS